MKLKYERQSGESGTVRLPGSKSISLRAEVLSRILMADVIKKIDCKIVLCGLSDSDDWHDLYQAFEKLEDNPNQCITFYFGYGAAPLRFFLAYASSLEGFCGKLDCGPELKERPIIPLVDALRRSGAEIDYLEEEGKLPLYVRGHRLKSLEGAVGIRVSSQFNSALMMASLLWEKEFMPSSSPDAVSYSYINMTEKMIDQFKHIGHEKVDNLPISYNIEGDWSAASYFYELALLAPGRKIRMSRLLIPESSLQGDSACAEIFDTLGVKTNFCDNGDVILEGNADTINKLRCEALPLYFNLKDTPDLAPALAVGLCMAGIPFVIEGIGHLRHKECDRLFALTAELGKAGYKLENKAESLASDGKRPDVKEKVIFDSHNDHRMAMSLAIAAVKLGVIEIRGAECISKSFPDFFAEIEKVGLKTL